MARRRLLRARIAVRSVSGPGHAHAHGTAGGGSQTRGRLWVALGLILAFMVAEVAAALWSGSLALLADAAHMLTDAAALVLALVALALAARPARGAFTYGLRRAEILSALVNGAALVALAVWIVVAAVLRLVDPPDVDGAPVVVVAVVGVVVNLAATRVLSGAGRESLNIEGAFQHLLTDLYAFAATAAAGVVVLATGFVRADALASLVVAALMLYAGVGLVWAASRVLLEAAPAGLDVDEVRARILAAGEVERVHDLHVWELTSGDAALSAHVLVVAGGDCHAVRRGLADDLAATFGLQHTTLQVEHALPDAGLWPRPRAGAAGR